MTTKNTHSKLIRSNLVQVCIQIGLIALAKLGYVETKTASSFQSFPKIWRRPNLHDGMHAPLAVVDRNEMARVVQLILSYKNAIMWHKHAKEKRKKGEEEEMKLLI